MRSRPDGWFASEQRLGHALVAELQRLKRRARARWLPILVIAAALTGAAMWKLSKKQKLHRAQIVLAVLEGSMSDRREPMPMHELHDYVASVLLNNQVLLEIIEEKDLFKLRHKLGNEYALAELRDMMDIGVHRNYFLYQYDVDAPRSARIMLRFTHTNPDFAWEMVNRLATLVIEGERARRQQAARALAVEARHALDEVNRRAAALEQRVAQLGVELAAADRDGEQGRAAALRYELGEVDAQLRRAHETILTLTQQANADEMAAAIDRAGLGLQFEIAEENRPLDEGAATLYIRIILGTVLFSVLLPVIAIFVGAFDTRVHDREDAERLGLPVLGHLPGFPGDRVGSLRARGLRGGRVPS